MPRDTSRPKSQWSVPEERLGGIEIAQDRDESFGGAHCLTVGEAERIIENLTEFDLQDVGNKAWLEQHGQIEKLNQQAHASARDKSDEFVLEAFLTFDKLGTLIYDLILIETWRERVYPLLVEHLVGGGENEATNAPQSSRTVDLLHSERHHSEKSLRWSLASSQSPSPASSSPRSTPLGVCVYPRTFHPRPLCAWTSSAPRGSPRSRDWQFRA